MRRSIRGPVEQGRGLLDIVGLSEEEVYMQGISMRNCRDYEGRNAALKRSTPGLKTLGILLVDASDETLHPALEEGRVDGHFRRVERVLHHCVRVCLMSARPSTIKCAHCVSMTGGDYSQTSYILLRRSSRPGWASEWSRTNFVPIPSSVNRPLLSPHPPFTSL